MEEDTEQEICFHVFLTEQQQMQWREDKCRELWSQAKSKDDLTRRYLELTEQESNRRTYWQRYVHVDEVMKNRMGPGLWPLFECEHQSFEEDIKIFTGQEVFFVVRDNQHSRDVEVELCQEDTEEEYARQLVEEMDRNDSSLVNYLIVETGHWEEDWKEWKAEDLQKLYDKAPIDNEEDRWHWRIVKAVVN